jgi:hypothetical protein
MAGPARFPKTCALLLCVTLCLGAALLGLSVRCIRTDPMPAGDSLNCRSVSRYDTREYAIDLSISGNNLYVTEMSMQGCTLRIIDASNPIAMSQIASIGLGFQISCDICVRDTLAYLGLSDNPAGLTVLNVANPRSPTSVGYCHISGYTANIAVSGSYVYVACGDPWISILDVSNPRNPREVGACRVPDHARGIAVSGDYAYVAAASAGLRVINVANRESTCEVGHCGTAGWAEGVAVLGNYVYVADTGLSVIDVANPLAPRLVGHCRLPNVARRVALSGSHAYVADYDGGLRIVDVSNPAHPSEVGYYVTPDGAENVAISGNYIYVTQDTAGVGVYEFLP